MEIKIPYYEDFTRISNSSLGWFLKSPKYYKDMIDRVIKQDPTSAMENGTMVHSYLLQQDEFKKTYKILDFETPGSSQQKMFCEQYIDSKENKPVLKAIEAFKSVYSTKLKSDDKIASEALEMALKFKSYIKWLRMKGEGQKNITWETLNSLKIKKENVLLHKKAKELLFNESSPTAEYYSEFHINWELPIFGKKKQCKSLIDRLIVDHTEKKIILSDVKTTISVNKFNKSFIEFDYGRQLAFYWLAIYWYFEYELKIDISDYTHETNIIAIDNIDNSVKVFSIPDSIIDKKLVEIRQIIADIDWHDSNNLWDYSREYYEGDGSEVLLYNAEYD